MSKRTIDYREAGTPEPVPATWQSLWRRRFVVVIAGVALLFLLVAILAGASSLIALNHLLVDGVLIVLWLLAAAGYGSLLPTPKGELRTITTIAIGLGIISLLQLGIGLLGELHRTVAWLELLPGILLLAFRARKLRIPD